MPKREVCPDRLNVYTDRDTGVEPMKFVAIVMVLSLVGCAAVFGKDTVTVPINSSTPGAQVYVDGMVVGATPMSAALDAHAAHTIQIRSADGRTAIVCQYDPSIGIGWVALDFILGFPLAPLIDAVTGDWSDFEPRPCQVSIASPGYEDANAAPGDWNQTDVR